MNKLLYVGIIIIIIVIIIIIGIIIYRKIWKKDVIGGNGDKWDEKQPIRINNEGYTCYRNASLQLLIYLPKLKTLKRVSELPKDDSLSYNFDNKVIKDCFLFNNKTSGHKNRGFYNTDQQDAAEFIRLLIFYFVNGCYRYKYDLLHLYNNLLNDNKIKFEDVVNDFQNDVKYFQYIFYKDRGANKPKELVIDYILSLEIKDGNNNINFQTHINEMNNYGKVYFSDYLLIQLNRFTAADDNTDKIIDNYNMEMTFDIKGYKFDLIGIIIQYGSLDGGHYISQIEYKNKWYECNDTIVTKIDNIADIDTKNCSASNDDKKFKLNSGYLYLYKVTNSEGKK